MIETVSCINTDSCSKKVDSSLRFIDGISEAYSLAGGYDVIAVVHGESFSKLRQIVLPQIAELIALSPR